MRHSTMKKVQTMLPASMKKHANQSLLLCASAAFVLLQATNSYANPAGADVVAGGISISKPSIDKLVVNQSTDKAIINWKNFDINENEWTQFVQPSSSSVALNRITGGKPTEILGKLSANGKLMVVNPNGVFFGSNSRVDVAGLIASTADITNSDFLAGKTNLSIAGKADAGIVNKGSITASDGGLVALVAPSVRNDGIIQANMGTVALASAQTASIDFYGDNLYSFALDKETTSAVNNETSAVTNSGIVSVGGGKVLLTAKVAKGVVDNVINNTGIIEASSAHMEGGTVVLDGGDGNVKVSGAINTSGKTGGKITITGENITLASANLNASGKNGGGTVKIGGDYQGKGATPHAKTVKADAATKINVSATDAGNGGTAIVWSNEITNFKGTILGTGGVNGGNGGLAEVSSKGELGYDGFADLHATNGETGTLLLDPGSLYLGNIGDFVWLGDNFVKVNATVATLNTGTNVTHTASNNISVLGDIIWSGAGSLFLNGGNNAIIEADIKSSFNGTTSQGAVTINAANTIQMGNADIKTRGGDITTDSTAMSMSNSSIKSSLGNVIINNSGKFGSNLANVLEGKSVTLHQSTAGSIQNAVNAIGHTGSGGGLLQLGDGLWNQDFYINNSNLTIKGNGSGNTFINAPYAFSTVIFVNGGKNVTISDLAVSGGTLGIYGLNSSGFKLNNTSVSGASNAGLQLVNTVNSLITNNIFSNNFAGIAGQNSVFTKVADNSFHNSFIGVAFDGDTSLTIRDNHFSNLLGGIGLNNVVGAPITGNSFDNTNIGILALGGNSLVIDRNIMNNINFGVDATDSHGIKITNNTLTGSNGSGNTEETGSSGPGTYGIHVDGGINSAIKGNNVDNFLTGIGVENSNRSHIDTNTVTNTVDAVFLNGNNHTLAVNNLISNAINGVNALLNTNIEITGNDISDTDTGILADNNGALYLLGNILTNNFAGASVLNSNGVVVNNNSVSENLYGVVIENSNDAIFNTNNFADNGTAVSFFDSNNAILDGDIFTGNVLGINLDNSQNTFIREATMTVPATGVGMLIQNGSGGTLVQGLNITGGGVGVILDGTGSSMQFSGDTSHFNGQDRYFQLQNNAMSGDTLDASEQFFEGVRASDFTVAERDAAEDKTVDVEDGIPTIGNVFYKEFIAPRTVSGFNTNGLIPLQEPQFNAGLFSYAGRTINNDPSITPPQFDVPSLNLSLLSPSAGGSAAANPAGLTPSQLGGLEPAAGGDNAAALAALEPAAGGDPNCGNSFLGAGFNNDFDPASCAVK